MGPDHKAAGRNLSILDTGFPGKNVVKTQALDEKLSLREKAGFACGDFASNLFFMAFTMYGLYFYTDVFGVSAAFVGSLFLLARIWDGLNDPIMGGIQPTSFQIIVRNDSGGQV